MYRLYALYIANMLFFAAADMKTQACFARLPQEIQQYLLMFVLDKDNVVKSLQQLYNLRMVNTCFYSYFNKNQLMSDYVIKILASRLNITLRAVALHISSVCKLNRQEELALLSRYQANRDFDTLLLKAAQNRDKECVQTLLWANAHVNAQDKYGWTALIAAAFGGYNEIVELLLKHGADSNAQDIYGKTALMKAAAMGYTKIGELLLGYGADVDARDSGGCTALIWSSREGYKNIIALLLKHGADVNAQDRWGRTSLMQAAYYNNKDIVELLLNAGADITLYSANNQTALSTARCRKYTEIVKLLRSRRSKSYCFIQ